jgi:threonine synthase
VQAAGCAPVVRAFERGEDRTVPWAEPKTRAWGLRVPAPLGGFLCLRALRATRGTAVAVEEVALERAAAELAARTGIDVCPEGGAAWAALAQLRRTGFVGREDTVVVFNTGAGQKYR